MGHGLFGQDFRDALVNGPFGDKIMDYRCLGLALTIDSAIRLNIGLQAPGKGVPHEDMAAMLQVQSRAYGFRMDEHEGDLPFVPLFFYFRLAGKVDRLGEALHEDFFVRLIPVGHKDGGGLVINDMAQALDLFIVDLSKLVVFANIDGPGGQLNELLGQSRRVCRDDRFFSLFRAYKLQDLFFRKPFVGRKVVIVKGENVICLDEVREFYLA